ncbi:MAG: hypothetical protein KAW12_07460 [Candidatus Aminicenantes bacterium]|nr:hypothetical protein [Candidatus Aminicenantes bacterium]
MKKSYAAFMITSSGTPANWKEGDLRVQKLDGKLKVTTKGNIDRYANYSKYVNFYTEYVNPNDHKAMFDLVSKLNSERRNGHIVYVDEDTFDFMKSKGMYSEDK